MPKKEDQIFEYPTITKKHSLSSKPNKTIFGADANSIVTDKIAPSYTSHNQKWKGAAPILNINTQNKKKKPQKTR